MGVGATKMSIGASCGGAGYIPRRNAGYNPANLMTNWGTAWRLSILPTPKRI
jgi:hypothetical protein